jgi:HEAT repeat protein/phosphoribosyl-ATP pyrophosphohydrolase
MKKKTLIVLFGMALILASGLSGWSQEPSRTGGEAAAWVQASDEAQAASQAEKAKQAEQEALAKAIYETAKQNIYKKSYEQALQQLMELKNKHGHTVYGQEGLYWLGYSLDKYAATLGDVKQQLEMRQAAIEHLDTLLKNFPANNWVKDAKILEMQIAGELVRHGLGKYRRYIDEGVRGSRHMEIPEPPEPPEAPEPPEPPDFTHFSKPLDPDTELKLVALDSLMGMDEEKAFPILEKMALNDKRPELREKALFILSQSDTEKVLPILIAIAEKDPSPDMRKKAIFWLGQRDEDAASSALIRIYETAPAESKEMLLMAFAQNDNPKGIAKISEIAKTEKDPEIRSKALFWLGQAEGEKALPILLEAYKTTDNVKIKQQIIMALAQSDGAKGVPMLIDLARKETNFEIKKQIIFWLGQSNDPAAAKFLQELIEK